jgi:hypothetical protein
VTDEDPFPEAYPSPRAALATPYLPSTLRFLAGLVQGGPSDPMPEDGAFPPSESLGSLRDGTRAALLGRAAEADADYRNALATAGGPAAPGLRGDALALLDEASQASGEALGNLQLGDRALFQRAVRVERVRMTMRARGLLAEADAATAAGNVSLAKEKTEEALLVARRAFELRGADAYRTERPGAALAYAQALLRVGRCREADDVLESTLREGRPGIGLSPYLAAVKNRRLGRDDLTPASADVLAFLEGAGPCREEGLAPVAAHVDKYVRAVELGLPVEMRAAATRVLFGVRELGVASSEAARALRGGGDVGTLEVAAVRAVFVREADPTDPALVEMLRSDDPDRRAVAMLESAPRGFERLAIVEVLDEAGARAADPPTRAVFAKAAGLEHSRWSLSRLVDLLADPEESVRGAAFAGLAPWLPKERAGFGYDAKGEAAARLAATEAIRAWLSSRP